MLGTDIRGIMAEEEEVQRRQEALQRAHHLALARGAGPGARSAGRPAVATARPAGCRSSQPAARSDRPGDRVAAPMSAAVERRAPAVRDCRAGQERAAEPALARAVAACPGPWPCGGPCGAARRVCASWPAPWVWPLAAVRTVRPARVRPRVPAPRADRPACGAAEPWCQPGQRRAGR